MPISGYAYGTMDFNYLNRMFNEDNPTHMKDHNNGLLVFDQGKRMRVEDDTYESLCMKVSLVKEQPL